jgi:hypothetical protein
MSVGAHQGRVSRCAGHDDLARFFKDDGHFFSSGEQLVWLRVLKT